MQIVIYLSLHRYSSIITISICTTPDVIEIEDNSDNLPADDIDIYISLSFIVKIKIVRKGETIVFGTKIS